MSSTCLYPAPHPSHDLDNGIQPFLRPYSQLYAEGSLSLSTLNRLFSREISKAKRDFEQPKLTFVADTDRDQEKLIINRGIYKLCIQAKEEYYQSSICGKISKAFQSFCKMLFGVFGYQTTLEEANGILGEFDKVLVPGRRSGLSDTNPKPEIFFQDVNIKPEITLETQIILARFQAMQNSKVSIFPIGQSDMGPTHIIIAKPNGDVYVLERVDSCGGKKNLLGEGEGRNAYRGHLHRIGKHIEEIAIVTTMKHIPTEAVDYFIESHALNTRNMRKEQKQLQKLKDLEGIIQPYDYFFTNINGLDVGFAMMPLYSSNLDSFLKDKKLENEKKIHLMKLLANPLEELHRRNKLHRDIKEKNILISEKEENLTTALIDFECCIDSNDEERKKEISSTIAYWPPEYIKAYLEGKEKIGEQTSTAMDIWAMGLIFYRIWYGEPLFTLNESDSKKSIELMQKFEGNVIENAFRDKKDEMALIIKSMLAFDPKERKLPTVWPEKI